MARPKYANRVVDSYTIKGTNKVVKAGDCVLMQARAKENPYVGRVEQIEADKRNNLKVRVRWYYWPEETSTGRRMFHGAKEVFLSDHIDIQSAHSIFGKCTVHSFKKYTKLKMVGDEDYYCRFEYYPRTQTFVPNVTPVYCVCEMPYNPDDLMVQCEQCMDWFHLECVGLKAEEAAQKRFVCSVCSEHDDQSVNDDLKKPIALANGNQPALPKSSTSEDLKKPIAFTDDNQPESSNNSIVEDVNKPMALANGQPPNEDVKKRIGPAKCKRKPKRQKS